MVGQSLRGEVLIVKRWSHGAAQASLLVRGPLSPHILVREAMREVWSNLEVGCGRFCVGSWITCASIQGEMRMVGMRMPSLSNEKGGFTELRPSGLGTPFDGGTT